MGFQQSLLRREFASVRYGSQSRRGPIVPCILLERIEGSDPISSNAVASRELKFEGPRLGGSAVRCGRRQSMPSS